MTDWIQTYTGKRFYPAKIREADIDIRDIAHALSLQCRFAGHCTNFYSVAQHSLWVSYHVPTEYRLHGLLHDATEAYLLDIPRPIKRLDELYGYRVLESAAWWAIAAKFDLPSTHVHAIETADALALSTELRDLMPQARRSKWDPLPPPHEDTISPYMVHPSLIEAQFLARAMELGINSKPYRIGELPEDIELPLHWTLSFAKGEGDDLVHGVVYSPPGPVMEIYSAKLIDAMRTKEVHCGAEYYNGVAGTERIPDAVLNVLKLYEDEYT